MAKGELDMLYLCAGGEEAMIFSFDQHLLRGGSEKNPEVISGGLSKKEKNK